MTSKKIRPDFWQQIVHQLHQIFGYTQPSLYNTLELTSFVTQVDLTSKHKKLTVGFSFSMNITNYSLFVQGGNVTAQQGTVSI